MSSYYKSEGGAFRDFVSARAFSVFRREEASRLTIPVHTAAGTKLPPLRYYNSDIHVASSVLPEFARAAVEPFVVKGTGP